MVSRVAKRRKTHVDLAYLVRGLTGPDFSTTTKPKGWSRGKYVRLLQKVGWQVLCRGCSLKHVRAWERGQNNLKVSASLHTPSLETLVYLDVDTRPGRTEDALHLLDMARSKLPHAEALVTSRGVGAWVRVRTRSVERADGRFEYVGDAPEPGPYNALLDDIQTYLLGLAAAEKLDVSSVEVHGRVPVIGYDRFGPVVHFCPDFLKCPPSLAHVPAESVAWATLRGQDWTPPAAAPEAKARLRAASKCWASVTDEQVSHLDHMAANLDIWFGDRPRRVRHWKISDRQFAEVALVIATGRPNPDGTTPYKLHKGAIQYLRATDRFAYGYSHDVYKVIRDYLADRGHLEVADRTYHPTVRAEDGTVLVRGKAMKWRMGDAARAYILMLADGQTWDFVTGPSPAARGMDPLSLRSGGRVRGDGLASVEAQEERGGFSSQTSVPSVVLGPHAPWRPALAWPARPPDPHPGLPDGVFEHLASLGLAC